MGENVWKIASRAPSKKTKNWLTLLLAKNRGLKTKKQVDDFLNPKIGEILSVRLTQTKGAIDRVEEAIGNSQKIIVYSDYDADGICATAIVWETLFDLGADVAPYVPHRIKEGYGLSKETISELAKGGVKLIITVDHGVTANEQIEHAQDLGIDVIVTDHHTLPKIPPKPYALVHTTDLAGAGVAWRFCWDLVGKLNPSWRNELLEKLELAALATVADLVPLTGANRAIVKLGLEKLANTRRPGLKALIRQSGINGQIGTWEIGHILAPRINAMGRIEHGMDSLRLLCTKNSSSAEKLAGLLGRTNSKRQDLTARALAQALQMLDPDQTVGIIAHDSLHEGVIGLVASRLVEVHRRPMIVIARGELYSRGSARSIPGFNIVEAIRNSSEFLVDGGGHPMAAGFTIKTQYIEKFGQKINEYAQKRVTDELTSPVINIECELKLEDITPVTLEAIEQFEPWGVANPQPIFSTKNMLVEDIRPVGLDNQHLKLRLSGFSAIGFGMREKMAQLRPGYLIDVVYTLDEDRYSGRGQLQLKIKDIAISN
ncbi:single-stranded-DNA-specific exonuclease RecJ [Candidatus Curtissbacteria bacterium]|nr:single-stranded-DNA-specific exonuclease RecJ [Candidatus Curtissbacteria bacterium]